jgi:hypothetical protein
LGGGPEGTDSHSFSGAVATAKIVTAIKECGCESAEGRVGLRCDPTQKRDRLSADDRAHKGTGAGVMLKSIYAVVVAAVAAGAFVTALSLADQVDARASGPKADRANARPLGGQCSQNAWPYFEAGCLRDTRNSFGQAHDVRVVSPERFAAAAANSTR